MVNVGMAAQDAHRGQVRVPQGGFQLLPLVVIAGVQQDAVGLIHLVEGDQLPAFQYPGVAFDLFQFHGRLLLLSLGRGEGLPC